MKYSKENIIKLLERIKSKIISFRDYYRDFKDDYKALEHQIRVNQVQEIIDLLNNEDILNSLSRVLDLED